MEPINPFVRDRIDGLIAQLIAGFKAGASMSSPVKGFERELFVTSFLSQAFPSHYRFTGGEITDANNATSGQVDIVLEFPFGYSFPAFPSGPRLFLAESVAAVIEVKSSLARQWSQVEEKARTVAVLERRYAVQFYKQIMRSMANGTITYDSEGTASAVATKLLTLRRENEAEARIPFYAVGFEGWSQHVRVEDKLIPGVIDGILVLNPPLFRGERASASQSTAVVMFLEHLEQDILRNAIRLPALMNYFAGLLPKSPDA